MSKHPLGAWRRLLTAPIALLTPLSAINILDLAEADEDDETRKHE